MDRKVATSLGVSAIGLVALALIEGYSGSAYKDTVGVPTIGYGETENVHMGDKTTPDRALAHLLKRVENDYASKIEKCIKVPLYQYEYDAYLSLSYNIGTTAFCSSTIVKNLNKEKYKEACDAMLMWNKPKEIIGRREKEHQMCLGN